jgi:hypothetical protein
MTGKVSAEQEVDRFRLRALSLDESRLCTKALYKFLKDFHNTVKFFFLVINLASQADKVRLVASEALTSSNDKRDLERYEEVLKNPNPAFDEIKKFSSLQSRNLVLGASNAFLIYYSEIIQSAILKRPEILKSKQTIRWDELLGFTRFDEVVRYLIDKKVNELSYAGLSQMEEFMFERLGMAGTITEDQRNLTAIFVEIRNIYTHNRGVVNGIFLARIKNHMGFNFREGKYFHVDFDHFSNMGLNCLEVAYAIDHAVATKYGLKRKRYKAWEEGEKKTAEPPGPALSKSS